MLVLVMVMAIVVVAAAGVLSPPAPTAQRGGGGDVGQQGGYGLPGAGCGWPGLIGTALVLGLALGVSAQPAYEVSLTRWQISAIRPADLLTGPLASYSC